MASYTTHYGLHQWVPEDDFLRTDFNADLEKIDTALGEIAETADGKVSIVTGSYTGNSSSGRVITLGFTPTAVYLCSADGLAGYAEGSFYCYGGLMVPNLPIKLEGQKAAEIVENGFKVYYSSYIQTNGSSKVYYYIAFR